MKKGAVLLLCVVLLTVVLVPEVVWAAPRGAQGQQLVLESTVADAIFKAARFLIAIVGAYELIRIMYRLIRTIEDGMEGFTDAVKAQLLNIGIAVLLIAIPFTGVWVPLANTLLKLANKVMASLNNAINTIQ